MMKTGLMSRLKGGGRTSGGCEGKRNKQGPETSRLPTRYRQQSPDAIDFCLECKNIQNILTYSQISGACRQDRVQESQFQRSHGSGARLMCPPLTCLHTRDAGSVKHALPLSGTQRYLVRQQVYLTQRPSQQKRTKQ